MMFNFEKMHGLGNDFIVLDCITQPLPNFTIDQIVALGNRQTGIGFDQMLVIAPSTKADFKVSIFNADGSPAEQCGNGLRCVSKFIWDHQLSAKPLVTLETGKSISTAQYAPEQAIATVEIGIPTCVPKEIPINATEIQKHYSLTFDNEVFTFYAVGMGNPHAMILVDDISKAEVDRIGRLFTNSDFFPQRINLGFMQVVARDEVLLRTYERGVGETQACGSNASASVVAGIQGGLLDRQVNVRVALGNLGVEWTHDQASVKLSGPAATVFSGTIQEDNII